MDRDRPSPNSLGARPNRRVSTQLNIDQNGRKPLFSKPTTTEGPGPNDTAPTAGANRFGFSPTNARPPSRAAAPRPPSSSSQTRVRPPSRAANPRPSSSLSQTPSPSPSPSNGSNLSAESSRIPRPKSTIGIFSKAQVPSIADVWQLAVADDERKQLLDVPRGASPAAIDVSPSPAPRLYLKRQSADETKIRQTLGRDAIDYSRPRPHSRLSNDSLRESYLVRYGGSPGSQQSASSSGSFSRRLNQYEREMEQSPSAARQPDNLFGNSRIGPKIAEAGNTLARKTSNSSLSGSHSIGRRVSNNSLNGDHNLGRKTSHGSLSGSPRPGAFSKSQVPEGLIKQLLDEDEKGVKRTNMSKPDWEAAADTALASVETGNAPQEPTPPASRPASTNPETRSPEKSYAWQLDADFTAGDLQISDSPRIRMGGGTKFSDVSNRRLSTVGAYVESKGFKADDRESGIPLNRTSGGPSPSRAARSNTRIEEIREREDKANEQWAEMRRSQSRAKSTKLEEIREKEAEVEEELALKAASRSYYPTPENEHIQEEDASTMKEQTRPKNTKLDEIRAKETELLSKRALASSRLEEIREQNSMSRDLSPEPHHSNEITSVTTPDRKTNVEPRRPANELGERVPNTPITIYRKPAMARESKALAGPEVTQKETGGNPSSPAASRLAHTRTDSQDILQRLAKAASNSPAAEIQPQPAVLERPETVEKEQLNIDKPSEEEKPRLSAQEKARQRVEERMKQRAEERARQRALQEAKQRVLEEPEQQSQEDVPDRDPKGLEKHDEEKQTEQAHTEEPEKAAERPGKTAIASRRRSEVEPKDGPKASESEKKSDMVTQRSPKDEPQESDTERPKPSVLRRDRRRRSNDSAKADRKSVTLSDGDPTDRITQEMSLFAPGENQSERGSRAPSTEPSYETDEAKDLADETPRPVKVDPLSLPTPKVTGAYVETPATVRVGQNQEQAAGPVIKADPKPSATNLSRKSSSRRSSRASSRGQSDLKDSESISEDSDLKEREKKAVGTSTTSSLRRRNKSLLRSRQPLINSVKPPTVKDDLMELQRIHQIEDSTLDDFEELFNLQTLQDAPSPEIESMLDEISIKREEVASKPNITRTERDRELEAYDRMSKTLKDGLLNIRSAKQGIERLEDKVSHTEAMQNDMTTAEETEKIAKKRQHRQQTKKEHRHDPDHAHNCPDCIGHSPPKEVSYVHVAVPSLYQRNPFRITVLGILFLLVSAWYAAESAMCELYCRPTTCSSTPCVWSSTDPTWGVALPVKLDEWATNGWGRRVANQLSEDASDLWADAVDFVTGADISAVDISTLDFFSKRQHRRRLRKKGLAKRAAEPGEPAKEHKEKWDAWHAARVASERVRDAREMGYDIGEDDESMGDDETL